MKQPKSYLTLPALLALLLALLLSACAAQTTPTLPPTADAGSGLKGTEWVLQTLNGEPVLSDVSVTVKLDETTLGGSDGCNSYSGTYQSEGSQFTVNPDMVSTMMACEETVMTQAAAYTTALAQAASYKLEGQQLTLLDAAGTALAVFGR